MPANNQHSDLDADAVVCPPEFLGVWFRGAVRLIGQLGGEFIAVQAYLCAHSSQE